MVKNLLAMQETWVRYEMVGWHHQCNGHEFEQAPELGDGRAAVHGVAKSQA